MHRRDRDKVSKAKCGNKRGEKSRNATATSAHEKEIDEDETHDESEKMKELHDISFLLKLRRKYILSREYPFSPNDSFIAKKKSREI